MIKAEQPNEVEEKAKSPFSHAPFGRLHKSVESSHQRFVPNKGIIVGRVRKFDDKEYKGKGQRKALKRAKVRRMRDAGAKSAKGEDIVE